MAFMTSSSVGSQRSAAWRTSSGPAINGWRRKRLRRSSISLHPFLGDKEPQDQAAHDVLEKRQLRIEDHFMIDLAAPDLIHADQLLVEKAVPDFLAPRQVIRLVV